MIYMKDHLKPLKEQVADAVARGDDSFCTLGDSSAFSRHLPAYRNMRPAQGLIVLSLRNVQPHNDDYVGDGDEVPETRDRRAIFWLLKGTLHIQVANDYKRMEAGDFVVFNDAMTHSVIAERRWYGAAWQLQPKAR